MRITGLFVFILLFSLPTLEAQDNYSEPIAEISYYSDIVANASLHSSKIRANEKLVISIESFLNQEGSFKNELETDIWLSVKSPSNKGWRIITWELSNPDKGSSYFGYIQMSDGSFIKLSDKSSEMDDVAYMITDKDYWYGALYYNLLEQTTENGASYFILFGYDNNDKFTNRKVAEVLSFDNGEPVFGKEVFFSKDKEGREDIYSRLFLEYSSDSNVSLNYNPGLGMIVYDHLINRMGMLEGQGPTMLPDGSYCGYKLANGKWTYVDKLFDQVSDTVPRPQPVLDGKKGRDLFGKKKKN